MFTGRRSGFGDEEEDDENSLGPESAHEAPGPVLSPLPTDRIPSRNAIPPSPEMRIRRPRATGRDDLPVGKERRRPKNDDVEAIVTTPRVRGQQLPFLSFLMEMTSRNVAPTPIRSAEGGGCFSLRASGLLARFRSPTKPTQVRSSPCVRHGRGGRTHFAVHGETERRDVTVHVTVGGCRIDP
jgi:hypothetical protein